MIRIQVKGPRAKAVASSKILRDLYDYFSVEIPHASFNPRWGQAIRYGAWDGKAHLFSRVTGVFPSGLVDLIIERYGPDEVFVTSDGFTPGPKWIRRRLRRLKKLRMGGIEKLSKFQKKAIRRAIFNPVGIIKIATNGGKTEIGAGLIKVLGVPTLYVIHRKTLLHQTAERIKERIGIKCGKVGDGLFKVKDVTVAMVQSLPKPIKKNKDFYDKFKMIIIDEAHHSGAMQWYKILMFSNAPFKYALTGTPWSGKDDRDLKLVGVFGPRVLIDVKNKFLIKSDWSATPTVHIWEVKHPNNSWSWRQAYSFMIAQGAEYNEKVIAVARKGWEEGKPTLVLVNQLRHGTLIYRRLLGEKIDCAFLHGGSPSEYREKLLKKFKAGSLGVIVATPIFDEGVDVPAIRCLILAGGGKAPITLLQRVGRALRKKKTGPNTTEIHDFLPLGNEHLESHSAERMSIFRQEEFLIKEHSHEELEVSEGTKKKFTKETEVDWHRFHREESR